MFQFPGLPSTNLWIQLVMTQHYLSRVAPFGNLRITGYFHLPAAYRR